MDRVLEAIKQAYEDYQTLKGGAGSGNFGHAGVPGKRGGSAPGGGRAGGGVSNSANRPSPPPQGKSFGKPAVHAATKKVADPMVKALNGSDTVKTGNGGTKFRTNSTIADVDKAAGTNGFKYEGFGEWKNSKGYRMVRSAPIGKSKGDVHTLDIEVWPPMED